MSEPLIFAFLFTAVVIGWLLGRFTTRRGKHSSSHQPLKQPYITGVNYLLNDQPDGAIDAFIAALEVNSETIETHLAIGNLSRRRGETDRAIRVHQNLLARPSLSREQRQNVQFELALDYTKAGWLDRAERILTDLLGQGGGDRSKILTTLVDLYQQEREWEQALDAAEKLIGSAGSEAADTMRIAASHFCCEIAEIAIGEQRFNDADKHLRRALQFSGSNARASILKARAQLGLGKHRKALAALKKMAELAPDKLIEALPQLQAIFAERDEPSKLIEFLEIYANEDASGALGRLVFTQVREEQGDQAALDYLHSRRKGQATLQELLAVLQIEADKLDSETAGSLNKISELLLADQQNRPEYRCGQCGFSGQQLHWNCPGCKSWGSVNRI